MGDIAASRALHHIPLKLESFYGKPFGGVGVFSLVTRFLSVMVQLTQHVLFVERMKTWNIFLLDICLWYFSRVEFGCGWMLTSTRISLMTLILLQISLVNFAVCFGSLLSCPVSPFRLPVVSLPLSTLSLTKRLTSYSKWLLCCSNGGCYLLSTALDFLGEERMMQQSSISISLSFWEPRYQSSRRPR